ncbi:MAG: M81 family metallopeptidase [Hyphomicrobiales bacterium]|nr:M81 family metallopeptidase [Hyphomicrobiales bacterium]MCP5372416.1 M81 family metallopeptidase [Hyphomicrobiales bacterium]
MTDNPRVALGGIVLESNAFAPVATEADFRGRYHVAGDALLAEARAETSVINKEMTAFVAAMDATGPWTPVPTLLTGCQPKGPIDQDFFEASARAIVDGIRAAAPVDAVYLCQHGAMVATGAPDPDGDLIARVRAAAGPEARIVVTLDLHANISPAMVENSDVLVSYLTNPHVDMWDRGEEAAFLVRRLLAGTRARPVLQRLPLTPPSVTLLTADGPYADLIAYGQRRRNEMAGAILNVSILGGFVFSDTPENGLAVVVTGRDDAAPAQELARDIAGRAWAMRERFRRDLTPLDAGVALAVERGADPSLRAVIFSDAGDNPGGGGGGDTTWLLKGLAEAAARGVYMGAHVDPALAAEAHALGAGAEFEAVFNRDGGGAFAETFAAPARIAALTDGWIVGRRGLHQGRRVELGPTALLEIGGPEGLKVVVISQRQQTADPMVFEQFALDIARARTVVVKSRGHFRAGFDLWFAPRQVYEIDTPGLTSPVLSRFDWKGLPRPVYPLDPETAWTPDGD